MKTNFLLLLLLILAVATTLGLIKSGSKQAGLGVYPEIVSFTAAPSTVAPGQPVTLAWQSRGAASLAMEYGPETSPRNVLQLSAGLPSSGTMTVRPREDTVYQLRCDTVAGPMCLPLTAAVRTK